MTNANRPANTANTSNTSNTSNRPPEQLELLPALGVPVQLRLSVRTRKVGLAGVARARAILAEQAARRTRESVEGAHIAPPRAA